MAQEEGPAYVVGDKLYFSPSLKRMPHGSTIPAGMVTVTEIVDHGPHDPQPWLGRDRWTYVVKQSSVGITEAQVQGAAEEELHFWDQNNGSDHACKYTVELRLSDCGHGCKIYQCHFSGCTNEFLMHPTTYGCTKG